MFRVTNRTLVRILALGGVVGALGASPAALADPAPNCTAADRAGISAGVQAATSAYLFAHPDVNEFMTGLAGQPVDEVPAVVQDYLNANPRSRPRSRASVNPWPTCGNGADRPLLNQE